MLYRPFAERLDDVSPEELDRLKGVHEGWYVEYKEKLVSNRDLAKSLSAFANQYGGWLFLGVKEDAQDNVAASFPGILDSEIQSVLDSLRNSAKDLLNPTVYYNVRKFEGPIGSIGLPAGRTIVVVQIPEGPNSPYIHNDGRIYRRVGDSSQPTPVTDRTTFDILAQRGEEARLRLAERVLWSPAISQAEEEQSFLHLSILSDPYETMGHWYSGSFADFSTIMQEWTLPFDNIFSTSDGFIARQVNQNNPIYRVFTWHFHRRCHSFVTIPVPTIQASFGDPIWDNYTIGDRFVDELVRRGITFSRILDLNAIIDIIGSIMRRHRILTGNAKVTGPFYMKSHLENIWRCIPFVDNSAYLQHVCKFGFPVIQDSTLVVPPGKSLETFVVSPEIATIPSEEELLSYDGPIRLSMIILNALGMPMEVLARSIDELHGMGKRRMAAQININDNPEPGVTS